jgi:hypothetical protein
MEETSYSYPPGDAPGPASLPPKARATPYDAVRTRISGKQPSPWEEFLGSGSGMDDAPSAPAAITPMEEQNTGAKRGMEEKEESSKKKKVAPAQSPPSLPPPPPGGAATLRPAAPEEEVLTPLDGTMELPVPTALAQASSSSSSGNLPPPGMGTPSAEKPSQKVKVLSPVVQEEDEEALVPLSGVMELANRRLRQVNLSLSNQRVW